MHFFQEVRWFFWQMVEAHTHIDCFIIIKTGGLEKNVKEVGP